MTIKEKKKANPCCVGLIGDWTHQQGTPGNKNAKGKEV